MNFAKITSSSNPRIREAFDVKNKRSRHKGGAFIIEGPHLIEMALASQHQIKEILFTSEFSSKKDGQRLLRQLLKKPGEISCELFEVTGQILNKLTDTETPQGIVAIASYIQKNLDELAFKSAPLVIVIDGVQEPGNLGTIIRTSDAAGADAVVILPGTCDAFMQKTLRSTAGSIFNIPIIHAESEKLTKWLKANSIRLVATAPDSDRSIFDADLKKPIAFIFGNEAHGVSREIKNKADSVVKIPIMGKAESLNVAVSAAVCLYEAVRQRTQIRS